MTESARLSAENWEDSLRFFVESKPKMPLVVLLGPTASGKTALSIRMAGALQSFGAHPEIVNADSRQLYKYLDIGTAKITPEEMEGVPHHLVSVLDPKEALTIAKFQELAFAAIDNIHARDGMPMLVGGSMLYISAIIDGLQPMPSDPALRDRLGSEYDADGGELLWQRLREVDPISAMSIPKENKVYLLRALEIFESTGKPKSASLSAAACPYDLLIFGLDLPVDELNRRIEERTKAMLDGGWIEEVRLLHEQGFDGNDPAMESHGYREILAAIHRGDVDLAKLIKDISTKGRHYAKRQRTWWRGDPRIRWIRPSNG